MTAIRDYQTFSDWISGFRQMLLLTLALRLDLPTHLRKGGRTAAQLAAATGVESRSLAIVLDALCASGFLIKTRGRYANSPAAQKFLVRNAPGNHYAKLRHSLESTLMWTGLLDRLAPAPAAARRAKAPGAASAPASSASARRAKTLSQPRFLQRPAETETFIRAMHLNALDVAHAVARACPLPKGAATLIDIGGGPGTFALELQRQNPGLRATIFDLPQTLRVTRKILRETGILPARAAAAPASARAATAKAAPTRKSTLPPAPAVSRVSLAAPAPTPPPRLLAGDYHTSDLQGPYDAALLSHVLHSLDEEGCVRLLRRAAQALRPGGRLFIHEFLMNPAKDGPLYPALFGVHMLANTAGGRAYSGAELASFLRAAGLTRPVICEDVTPTTGIVWAERPRRS